jgi:hypothetical protein
VGIAVGLAGAQACRGGATIDFAEDATLQLGGLLHTMVLVSEEDLDGDGETPPLDPRQSQGDGFYTQAGYLYRQWQPWVAYEQWDSDHAEDKGTYDMYRIGVTRFLRGQQANIKAGFEQLRADAPLKDTREDTINTFVVGLYLSY